MSLYAYPDGHYELHLGATHEAVQLYHQGKRTLVHVPLEWPVLQAPKAQGAEDDPGSLSVVVLRPLKVGDKVGLYMPPRVRLTPITSIETMPLHDMEIGHLVALGRTEADMDAYRASWDLCWAEEGFPWSSNPDVLEIRWEPLQ